MTDFHQTGSIPTFHNIAKRSIDDLEQELAQFNKIRPIGLVLPSLFSELEGPALENIVKKLSEINYLSQVVIGIDRASKDEFKYATQFFKKINQEHRLLWNDGPRLKAIDAQLQELGLAPKHLGKGRNVWYCFGYMLATKKAEAIALHDCDILTYERDLLAKLVYPVANPKFNYEFCKGYYARIADNKMGGRVSRLFVTPLLRSLKKTSDKIEFLDYLDSFRYPLAGEFSMRLDVLSDLKIPSDWGLEIGVLSEVYRNYSTNRLCQVEIADNYDHKHQDLSIDDANAGLSKMSVDIAKAVFRKLAINGEVFSNEKFRSIKASYFRTALDFVDSYQNDAVFNGLNYDRHKEEASIEMFAKNIVTAGNYFIENPMDTPFIPSWNRVISAVPDILDQLAEAVEQDRKEFAS